MLNEVKIKEWTCKYAIAGGNNEIIHICEQNGFHFSDCLEFSVYYHRFELFEWLNMHFEFEPILPTQCVKYYNEPLFYYYISDGLNIETKDYYGFTPINNASSNGLIEIVKYLYETYHVDVEQKDNMTI